MKATESRKYLQNEKNGPSLSYCSSIYMSASYEELGKS